MGKKWKHLRPGDVVDIIAPASHTTLEKLQQGVEWLHSLKLVPRFADDIICGDTFYASPLESQLKQLKRALQADSKAIWCLRGGYGSMRLIPYLRKVSPPRNPKLFIGFSDITSLHLYLNQEWNWPTIHGRNICQFSSQNEHSPDRREMKKLILGKLPPTKSFKGLRPLNDAAKNKTSIQGKIVGGNLRILQSSLGTDWKLKAKGKFLFIEDVSERGYSVARMLEQLKQAKIIDKGLKGLLIGDFTEGEEENGRDLTMTALKSFAQSVDYPVVYGLPCGHHIDRNFFLPLNTNCLLELGKKCELVCEIGNQKKWPSY